MTAHTPDDAVPGTFDPDSTAVDRPRIEAAVREILLAIGEDPDREGLADTPARVPRPTRSSSRACTRARTRCSAPRSTSRTRSSCW